MTTTLSLPRRAIGKAKAIAKTIYASPFSERARTSFRFLAQYYPPTAMPGTCRKIGGLHAILQGINTFSIKGDIVECGVGFGASLVAIGSLADALKLDARLLGFDSFAGFPEPGEFDRSARNPVKGDVWARTSIPFVRQHFADAGLNAYFEKRVTLTAGFFSATLPSFALDSISFLNLDVDLYESYRDCLTLLGPKVTGIVLYDEFDAPNWPGATRAIREEVPKLKHVAFKSELLGRLISMPAARANDAFGKRIVDDLLATPVAL